MKFIYVFSEEDKLHLLAQGFNLINSTKLNGLEAFVFENKQSCERFSATEKQNYLFSDNLNF